MKVQITIGVQNLSREVVVEVDGTSDKIAKDVLKALEVGAPIDLTDAKGRRVMVPANAVGFVELGSDEARRVGFGA
ncbi:DUF3107 domain-containing protein [Actinotalea sp. M2MS4P-6]|uniref:DUF3107 domain-containing protein n=1 Tax=Actinotalea sp. M2MS4P-6 TaxID=2983762 RepID=UPI00296218A9|nr:DUF3107 domain-containing protein [Actinotalea sp. M2MS4P-6]